jgi:hypothetical protein
MVSSQQSLKLKCQAPGAGGQRNGFALVLALTAMSFILLILLVMTALVKVETTASSRQLIQLQARQNALLAAMVALGELQKNAGPDQRVTARADILGAIDDDDPRRFWTGVWDSTNPSASPRWLVSGNDPDPTTTTAGERILGPETVGNRPENFVFVPKAQIDSVGSYSFWVSDEGLKASIGVVDSWPDLNITGYSNAPDTRFRSADTWRREYARKTTGAIFDIADFLPSASGFSHAANTNGQNTRQLLSRALVLGQLSIDSEVTIPEDFISLRYHDFALNNYFTLSNTLDGGLRQDLSHLRRLPEVTQTDLNNLYNQPSWDFLTPAIRDFVNFDRVINFDPTATKPVLEPNVRDDFMDEPVSFSTNPIVTELVWNAGLGIRNEVGGPGGSPTRELYLYFYNIGEFLNPYIVDLSLDNGSGSFPGDPSDVLVRISNFPSITIRNNTKNSEDQLDLSELVVATGINTFNDFDPGYIRPNFAPTNSFRSAISGSTNVGVFAVKIGEVTELPAVGDDFTVTFGISDLLIELRESNTNPIANSSNRQQWAFFLSSTVNTPGVPVFSPQNDPTAGPLTFQEITLLNWGGFSIDYAGSSADERFVRGGTLMNRTQLNAGLINFGIHAKFVDEWNDSLALSSTQLLDDLFTFSDLRKRRIEIDMDDPFSGDGVFFDVTNPRDMDRANFTKSSDFFQGAEFGSDLNNRRARIFDLPFHEPLSVASLNHLLFEGFPYQPLGNTANDRPAPIINGSGNEPNQSLNNFFDRYFFSTLPEDPANWTAGEALPNARIISADARATPDPAVLGSPRSAEKLLVRGGFNINSLSETAWTALLNPRKLERVLFTRKMSATDRIFSSTQNVTNISRLFYSQPSGGDYQIVSTSPTFSPKWSAQSGLLTSSIRTNGSHEAFIQGFRELSFNQTEDLGSAIVDQIRRFTEREGRPFLSLTEFLNEGVLQNAIDAVPSINAPGSGRIPTLAPAFVSAGSILNSLATALFARSDTFVIRTAGFVENPITGNTTGSAYLEARVQRIPAESNNSSLPAREFKITSIRWIQP